MTVRIAFVSSALLLAACASTGGSPAAGALDAASLFGADGKARFAFYYSCAGSVSQESELCAAPASDFSEWASDRGIPLKRVPQDEFDERTGVAPARLMAKDKDLPYRVFVRFAPIAIGSVQWSANGEVKGGYTPPKAGYQADIFVFDTAGGKLAAQTHLSNRSDAPHRADPTPFVHDGAQAVLAALTARGAQTSAR